MKNLFANKEFYDQFLDTMRKESKLHIKSFDLADSQSCWRSGNISAKDSWKYVLDIPGVDPSTVEVTLAGRVLNIKFGDPAFPTYPVYFAPLVEIDKYDFDKLEVVVKFGQLIATAPQKVYPDLNSKSKKILVKIA